MRALALLVLALCAIAAGYFATTSPTGEVVDRWQTQGGDLRIRVEKREEQGWLPGAHYVFQSSRSKEPWREIMTFRHDDPVPIPRDNIRFVNNRVAFVFMGWMFAVTPDGGSNWFVWNAQTDLPNWTCCNYGLIKDVSILADGDGTMTLKVIDGRRGEEVPVLETTDYGRHWTPSHRPH